MVAIGVCLACLSCIQADTLNELCLVLTMGLNINEFFVPLGRYHTTGCSKIASLFEWKLSIGYFLKAELRRSLSIKEGGNQS